MYLPAGTAPVFIALLMLLVMIRRPEGVIGPRELGTRLRRRVDPVVTGDQPGPQPAGNVAAEAPPSSVSSMR